VTVKDSIYSWYRLQDLQRNITKK